jgi:hypothetical protein
VCCFLPLLISSFCLNFKLFCQPDLGTAKVIEILIHTEKKPDFWAIFSVNPARVGNFS